MPPTLTAPHPIFALSRERSRSYLYWARRLVQAEGVILLLGALMMFLRGYVPSTSPYAWLGVAALGILSLTLGWQVGRGSAPAVMILLGLSISRGVMNFVPGAPEWWTTFPLLTLVELFVFTQGARGAIALAQRGGSSAKPAAAPIPVKPIARTELRVPQPNAQPGIVARKPFKFIMPVEPDTQAEERDRRFAVDCAVAALAGAISIVYMSTDVPTHSEGLQGLGETLLVMFGMFNFLVTVVLLVSSIFARKGKSWAKGLRVAAYTVLIGEALIWIRIKI